MPAEKTVHPVASGAALAELSSCLFMGTVVHEGAADAVVVNRSPHLRSARKPW